MLEDYKNALEKLNIEYKSIYNSKEYRLGKKILKRTKNNTFDNLMNKYN